MSNLLEGRTFTDAYSQRTLHYLEYTDALKVLKVLHTIVEDKLFISVMGIESDAGTQYACREENIENRFCGLEASRAEKFCIAEPVCLYTKEEFEKLLAVSGWRVEKCWQSAFGNIKAICSH